MRRGELYRVYKTKTALTHFIATLPSPKIEVLDRALAIAVGLNPI
jgi:hypothetical protein